MSTDQKIVIAIGPSNAMIWENIYFQKMIQIVVFRRIYIYIAPSAHLFFFLNIFVPFILLCCL